VSTLRERLEEAKNTLGRIDAYADEFTATAERLAAIELEVSEFEDMLRHALPARPKTEDAVHAMSNLFTSSPTIQDRFRGTGWAAVNAVTEYFDWGRERSTDEGRFHSALDGTSSRIRSRATALLLAR
jgi:hypothetical protein